MAREFKRIDLNFDWYEKIRLIKASDDTWFGYNQPPVICKACDSTGENIKKEICPVCGGDGKIFPRIEPPEGEGWQYWQNTSDGSPISPVFKSPEELAQWLVENADPMLGIEEHTKEQWLKWMC